MLSYTKVESVLSEQTAVLVYEYLKFADKMCKLVLDDKPDYYNGNMVLTMTRTFQMYFPSMLIY